MIFLSIITPTFNEAETIEQCIQRVSEVMSDIHNKVSYEHIILDNASTDSTVEKATYLSQSIPNVVILRNDKNLGGAKSIYRGLSFAQGQYVVPMLPADLQDPAEAILDFLRVLTPETDVIFGVRTNRQESFIMRTLRSVYYRTIRKLSHSSIPLHSGDFCLVRRDVVDSLLDTEDESPYVRGMIAQAACNPIFIEYTWGKRKAGQSKASAWVLFDLAISGLVSTSQIPARIALALGFFTSFCAIIVAVLQAVFVLLNGRSSVPGISTVIVAVFLFGGLQLFFIGLIGEYILSIQRQIKKTPKVKTRLIQE
jgi:glycosyltransferase involved in cell wall biosynthesis